MPEYEGKDGVEEVMRWCGVPEGFGAGGDAVT